MAPLQNEEAWRFLLAGTSCMCAAAVTNPIDVVKIRMQLENEMAEQKGLSHLKGRYYDGWVKGCTKIVHDEGIFGLYKGSKPRTAAGSSYKFRPSSVQGIYGIHVVFPSLMREGSYSTIRLGAYEPLKRCFGATDPAHTPLWKKICSGAISGAIGSSIATPTDLVKVRMQAEGKLQGGEVKRYRNTFSAFKEIFREAGIRGLYTGVGPTVKRAAILTATQIPAYDHTKHVILNADLMTEGIPLHVTLSMIAGFCTAVTTSPVDVVKTRVMNQCQVTKPYKSAFDCFFKTLRSEGPLGLYKGFIPNWMRIGPHTIVTFFVFEQLRKTIGMSPV